LRGVEERNGVQHLVGFADALECGHDMRLQGKGWLATPVLATEHQRLLLKSRSRRRTEQKANQSMPIQPQKAMCESATARANAQTMAQKMDAAAARPQETEARMLMIVFMVFNSLLIGV
jgi:hypothetical protein